MPDKREANKNNLMVIRKKKVRGSYKVFAVGQELMYVLAKSFELTRLMNLEYWGSGL
jgi:hypothetical protein